MKRRIGTVAIGLAAVVALIAVPAAMAAYASPKLDDHADSDRHHRQGIARPERRPDGRASCIVAPNGTQLTTTQAPGTVLGPVKAIVKALDLAGADLPLDGQLDRRSSGSDSCRDPGRVHRRRRHPARDVGHGADGRRSDAPSADLPHNDACRACADRPGSNRDLLAASGRSRRNTGPRDVRSQGLQRRARRSTASSRRLRAGAWVSDLGAVHAGRGQAESRGPVSSLPRRLRPARSACRRSGRASERRSRAP